MAIIHLEAIVEKHLVTFNLKKTICAYIIKIAFEAPERIQHLKEFSACNHLFEEVVDKLLYMCH